MDLKERNESMKTFFNKKIDTYDDVHSTFMTTKNQMIDSIDVKPKKVLDLGAGTGLELIHLFEKFPSVEVCALDISDKMLGELNKRSFASHVKTVCGDFFEVDFGNEYDTVISTSALHHFLYDDKKKLYEKIFDCMAIGGEFLNCDKIAIDDSEEEEQMKNYDLYRYDIPHIDTPLTVDHEISLLEEVGFSDITAIKTDKDNYRLIKAIKR